MKLTLKDILLIIWSKPCTLQIQKLNPERFKKLDRAKTRFRSLLPSSLVFKKIFGGKKQNKNDLKNLTIPGKNNCGKERDLFIVLLTRKGRHKKFPYRMPILSVLPLAILTTHHTSFSSFPMLILSFCC